MASSCSSIDCTELEDCTNRPAREILRKTASLKHDSTSRQRSFHRQRSLTEHGHRPGLLEQDCVAAFKGGNKRDAEHLLTLLTRPAMAVDITFQSLLCVDGEREVACVSLLHLAAYWGWKDIASRLVAVHRCSATGEDDEGHVSLHYAAYNGRLEVVRYFIVELDCDPMVRNKYDSTPLHCACITGYLNIVQYLISEKQCNPSCVNNSGTTPLHYACRKGHLKIVQYLISATHCNPSCVNDSGTTPLHYACRKGHLKIVQYLISEIKCDPLCVDNLGNTPLHDACNNGYFNIVKYLISETQCDPSRMNNSGTTPLRYACRNGHFDIVHILISEAHCDPSCVDKLGSTPLHVACICNHSRIVQFLLSTGKVNPLAKNKNGRTPLSFATGKYDIIKLFQPFVDCSRDFPVHTFTKLILAGDSGAGKTTMAKLIKIIADRASSAVTVDCVTDVQRFTAGIIPHHIESELGNFVVYDFAGQQEYYSSHEAVLEHVMRKSAAMFLCMIDLSKGIENIRQSLHYWLTFIDNACSTAEETSCVAIIGSHVDQVASNEIEDKRSVINEIVASRVKHQKSFGYIAMDCRHANTNGSRELVSILSNSHKAITANQPSISYYCHVLYAFLRTKLEVVGCKLDDLVSAIASENDCSLPEDESILTELLTTLSDKGLILFMDEECSQIKWVVVKTETLLDEINGTLFAPRHFKEHRALSSNTGIVPTSNLHKVFPQHNLDMLASFLLSLDFCRPVDPSVLQYTNLQATPTEITPKLFFFPGLNQSERPDTLTLHGTLQFGWCLDCLDRNQFFSSRFLHLLLLSVAYRFPLADRRNIDVALSGLQRRCTVWKNGISWSDSDNITTVVELIDKNRCVLVAMSSSEDRPVEHAKLRSELISMIRCLQQNRCKNLQVCECLISPSLVQQYPLDDLPDTDLFDIQDVAMSILHRKPSIRSQNKECNGHLPTQSLPLEPYHFISSFSVCQLFNSDMADQPVPVSLLQEVQKHICLPERSSQVSCKGLKEQMDKLSIFAGRNPLVSISVLVCNPPNYWFFFSGVYRRWLG